jgi:hypothetical protein
MKTKLFIIILIGLLGFLIFTASVGEVCPEVPTNWVGIILGILLISIAFWLGSQKKIKEYIDKNLNNEA